MNRCLNRYEYCVIKFMMQCVLGICTRHCKIFIYKHPGECILKKIQREERKNLIFNLKNCVK